MCNVQQIWSVRFECNIFCASLSVSIIPYLTEIRYIYYIYIYVYTVFYDPLCYQVWKTIHAGGSLMLWDLVVCFISLLNFSAFTFDIYTVTSTDANRIKPNPLQRATSAAVHILQQNVMSSTLTNETQRDIFLTSPLDSVSLMMILLAFTGWAISLLVSLNTTVSFLLISPFYFTRKRAEGKWCSHEGSLYITSCDKWWMTKSSNSGHKRLHLLSPFQHGAENTCAVLAENRVKGEKMEMWINGRGWDYPTFIMVGKIKEER